MNTKNNQRFQATEANIKMVFVNLLKEKCIDKISVSEICKLAKINRTTFYLHYSDVYELMQKTEADMSHDLIALFTSEELDSVGDGFLKLFYYIREHRDFYQGYLHGNDRPNVINVLLPDSIADSAKAVSDLLGYKTEKELQYHQEFFKAGLTALIKLWLSTGCQETPEELAEIIIREYSPQKDLFRY